MLRRITSCTLWGGGIIIIIIIIIIISQSRWHSANKHVMRAILTSHGGDNWEKEGEEKEGEEKEKRKENKRSTVGTWREQYED